MPNYNFRHKKTGEIETKFMTNSEREEYLKSGEYEQVFETPPLIGDPVHLGVIRHDNGFNDMLKDIAKRNSKGNLQSTINYR